MTQDHVRVEDCDLVMKGGITSGVIFPKLISRLSSMYRFRNIGGTSAGAIAASACAAAQYGRSHGNPQAFEALEKLPDLLGEKITPKGPSKLFSLFQPAPGLRPHFAVLMQIPGKTKADAILAVLTGLVGMQKTLLLLGLLAGSVLLAALMVSLAPAVGGVAQAAVALGMLLLAAAVMAMAVRCALRGSTLQALLWFVMLPVWMGMLLMAISRQDVDWPLVAGTLALSATALLFLGFWLVLLVAGFAFGILRGLHRNNYGFCSGKTVPTAQDKPSGQEGLTNWLTVYINALAGLPMGGPPLTFEHLWGHNEPEQPSRDINLEMMTTAISQNMVYGIPFRPGTASFYYDPDEWANLFPAAVMDYLNAIKPGSDDALAVQNSVGKPLRMLARHGQLPVVVATRMSLSFPLLLSALPLYSIDWSLKSNGERKNQGQPIQAKRVWFSDGGLGSNLPLHMFDALLPERPTFAVNLKPKHPDYDIKIPETPANEDGRIYLPEKNSGGRQRYWPEPDDAQPLDGLVGFFSSMVNTMLSWRDEIVFPYPGFRDRIIQISQRPDEGGLNLDMPEDRVKALGNAGEMAAQRLIDRFHPDGASAGKGWAEHQETRLKTLLGTLQPASTLMASQLHGDSVWKSIVASMAAYTPPERKLAQDFIEGLEQLGALGPASGESLDKKAPKPLARLRITPRI